MLKIKKKVGRQKVDVNWKKVDYLLNAHCSGRQIAAYLGMHQDTLYRHCVKEKKMTWDDYAREKKSAGKAMLKVKMFETSMSGDVAMMKWQAKQLLGQSEKIEHKMRAVDVKNKTDEELKEMAAYAATRSTR
jgi:IS30 family transposase